MRKIIIIGDGLAAAYIPAIRNALKAYATAEMISAQSRRTGEILSEIEKMAQSIGRQNAETLLELKDFQIDLPNYKVSKIIKHEPFYKKFDKKRKKKK